MEFNVGIYKVKGLFWRCNIDNEKKKVDVLEKSEMKVFELEIKETTNLDTFVLKSLEITNSELGKFLKEKEIKRWFPARRITFDFDNNTKIFEICYYQNQNMYDIVYKSDKNYVLEPNIIIKSELDKFYNTYNLNYMSDEIYASS